MRFAFHYLSTISFFLVFATLENKTDDRGRNDWRYQEEWRQENERYKMSSTTKIEQTNQHVSLLNRMEIYSIKHYIVGAGEIENADEEGEGTWKNNTRASLHTKCRCMCVCVCVKKSIILYDNTMLCSNNFFVNSFCNGLVCFQWLELPISHFLYNKIFQKSRKSSKFQRLLKRTNFISEFEALFEKLAGWKARCSCVYGL